MVIKILATKIEMVHSEKARILVRADVDGTVRDFVFAKRGKDAKLGYTKTEGLAIIASVLAAEVAEVADKVKEDAVIADAVGWADVLGWVKANRTHPKIRGILLQLRELYEEHS